MSNRARDPRWDVHQLDKAAEIMHDAVLAYDEDARIVVVNELLLTATGYTREELLGEQALILMPEHLRDDLAPRMAAYVKDPVTRGFGQGLDLSIRRKDGTTFDAGGANTPVRGPDGLLVMVAIRDVKDLSLDEIRFRGLLESAPDATLILDSEGRIELSNHQAEQLFGLDRIRMFDQSLALLFPGHHANLLLDRIRSFHRAAVADTKSHPALPTFELEAVRADGQLVPVEIQVAPLPTTEGLLIRVAVRDISERQRLQAETDRVKDEFLATVSHELRTPLTSILGYAELLADLGPDEVGDRARDFVAVITRGARRELRLVDDLLTLVRIAKGDLSIRPALIDLRRVVVEGVESVEPAALEADVRISFVTDGTDVHVRGDRDRLGQAIDNLITNAVKFSPRGGHVHIDLGSEADMATVKITDKGPGIHEDDMAQVFDRLYRGEHAVKTEKPGAGLGLPIVKAIVDAHHGRVSLTSEPGVETCFEILLPLAGRET